jgi:hypothetical protein
VRDYEPIARELGTKVWEKEVLLPQGCRLRLVRIIPESFKLDNGKIIRYTLAELEEY